MSSAAIGDCLIGCAVGDALGFIVEGYDATICSDYVNQVLKPGLVPVMTRLPQFTFGQYSDDTQLTREFVLHLRQTNGVIDANVYATRIAMLFAGRAPYIVGYGRQTKKAAMKVIAGTPHNKSGCRKGQGNGGIMRSAIIGAAMVSKTKDEVAEVAKTLSAITHASRACKRAAAVIALAAHYCALTRIRAEPFDPVVFLAYIAPQGDPNINRVSSLYMRAATDAEAKTAIIEHAVTTNGERHWPDCISFGVSQTTMWSIWCVLRHPDNYMAAVTLAISAGGDVDTTAAIVGAIVACRCDEAVIPDIYRRAVHDYDGSWNYDDLRGLAARFA